MTKREILEMFVVLVDYQFPDESVHTDWRQEPYRDRFFELSRKGLGFVCRDDLTAHLKQEWSSPPGVLVPPGRLSAEHERQLEEILDAWDEWQYAMKMVLPR